MIRRSYIVTVRAVVEYQVEVVADHRSTAKRAVLSHNPERELPSVQIGDRTDLRTLRTTVANVKVGEL